jgi:hypothetical protein
MCLDGGGGTVDVSTVQITAVDPLAMAPIAPTIGDDCGADMITKAFELWLTDQITIFSPELAASLTREKAPIYLDIVKEFNCIKQSFSANEAALIAQISLEPLFEDRSEKDRFAEIISRYNQRNNTQIRFVPRNGNMSLPWAFIRTFFDPFVERTINLIRLAEMEAVSRQQAIDNIVMVGGFAESEYLRHRIKMVFDPQLTGKLRFPNLNLRPQAAVMIGAAHGASCNVTVPDPPAPPIPGPVPFPPVPEPIISQFIAKHTVCMWYEKSKRLQPFIRKGDTVKYQTSFSQVGFPIRLTQTHCQWKLFISDEIEATVANSRPFGNISVAVPQVGDINDRKMKATIVFYPGEIVLEVETLGNQVKRETIDYNGR